MADVTTTFAAKDESFAKTVDNLNGRLQGFQGQTESFTQRVSSMAGEFAKFAVPIAGVAAAFLGAKSMASAFSEAIRIGGELNDLSARTGETAGNLAVLQRAFDNAGASAGQVGPTINRLQRNIVEAGESAEGPAARAFGKLGLSLEEVKAMTPTEQLQAVAKALQGVTSDAERTAIAQQLLGKSGGEIIPLLRAMDEELAKARRQLGSYAEAIDRSNKALDDIGDNFGAIAAKGREFATGLMVNLAPALAEITTKIAEIDAAGFGMMLSDYFKKMMESVSAAFKLGEAIDSVKLAIEAITSGNFAEGLSLMWVTMKVTALNAINEIVSNFMAGFMTVRDFIAEMFSGEGALAHLIGTMGDVVANKLISVIGFALSDMVKSLGPAFESVAESIQYNAETAARKVEMLTFGMGAQFELVGEQAAAAGRAMPENFEKNKASLQPLFDLTPALQEQERLHASIGEKLGEMRTSTEAIAENSTTLATNLEAVERHLSESAVFSADISLNLNSAADAAERIPPAFSLAEGSSEKIAFNLNTTADSGEETSEWLADGSESTARISIHGRELSQSGQQFAASVAAAKIDAQVTSDLFKGLSDRMNSAVKNTSEMLDKMREAFHFGKMTQGEINEMRRLENKQRLAENARDRAYERAERMEKNGQEKAAHNLRMRADAALTKTLEKLQPEMEKAAESARKALEHGGQSAESGMKSGASVASDAMKSGGREASGAMHEAADAIRDALSDSKDKGALALEATLQVCRDFLKSIDEKLPQNSLS